MEKLISRRALLKNTAGILALSAIGPGLLSSCKKNNGSNEGAIAAKEDLADIVCASQNLSDEHRAIRKNLRYVDQTPISTRTCDNCKLYNHAASQCGGCKVVPGPIHPKGYCSSWYALM